MWLFHWDEDPEVAADLVTMERLCIQIEGATHDELARGRAAAVAVFSRANMPPYRAAQGYELREDWDGAPGNPRPSQADLRAAALWDDAEIAAAEAACKGWTRPKVRAKLSVATGTD